MKNRDIYWRRYKKHCTHDSYASVPFKVGTLGPHNVLPIPISCRIIFSWISSTVWNLFPFKGDFSFGKSQKSQGTKSGLWGSWVTWEIWSFAKKFCTRRDAWAGVLSPWSCQSSVAHSCGLLNHPNSFRKGTFKLNAESDAVSLLYSLSHFECDGHRVHMLNEWHLLPPVTSTVMSPLFTYVHSSPLSLVARSHQCHTNHSHYCNNGCTFSGQTSYTWVLPTRIFIARK